MNGKGESCLFMEKQNNLTVKTDNICRAKKCRFICTVYKMLTLNALR